MGGAILKWIFMKWDGGMDWIGLAQYRDTWLNESSGSMKCVEILD
jgi:hypothetical protein